MVRDGVASIVSRLRECGFDPRKVSHDARESRCPAHRGLDHAVSVTRNEFNHVVLEKTIGVSSFLLARTASRARE
jgi:hypothetical protein